MKYGESSFVQTDEYKIKNSETRNNRYGYDPYCREKFRNTCNQKYGVENVFQLKEVKDKSIDTMVEKYGVPYYSQTDEWLNKSTDTSLNCYGFTHYSLTDEFKQIFKDRYNEIVSKIYNTKKKNKTFGKSREEDIIYNKLVERYGEVIRQYKSDLYPFPCDFYIPKIDLYIEYNGFYMHGKEPYIGSNEQLEKVKLWESKNTIQYKRAVDIWTIRDPLKRQIAKDNKLIWIEFFNMNEFDEWYNKIKNPL
jgi:hypothetical protein